MTSQYFDLILHPVRMKIIQCLEEGRRLTVQQMQERMPHVAQATLYRQVNRLVEAGFVLAVEENQVRGTIERVFALKAVPDITFDATQVTKEELLQNFVVFLTNHVSNYDAYLRQEHANVVDDLVTYRQGRVYLTREEQKELLGQIRELLRSAGRNEPSPGRRPIQVTSMWIPEAPRLEEEDN